MQRLTFIYFNGILVFAAILLFCTVGIVDAGEPVPNYFTGIAVSDNAIYTIRLTNETTTTANALIKKIKPLPVAVDRKKVLPV